MLLVTAATDFEMKPFLSAGRLEGVRRLVTGMGPVEAAVNLYSWLSRNGAVLSGVINFGVAGAYILPAGGNAPRLLDICLAEVEIMGDLGVCLGDRIERIGGPRPRTPCSFPMDPGLLAQAGKALSARRIPFYRGTFVTVSCASGTARRGKMLAEQYQGLCENMEGAAVARVCREFGLPCLELRCVSNMVEDRDKSRWQLRKACRRAGEAAALVVDHVLASGNDQPAAGL